MNNAQPRNPSKETLGFSRGVYDAAPGADSSSVDALRAELRSEVSMLRTTMTRASASTERELLREITELRAAIEELAPLPKRDRVASVIRARGVEGPAATALAAAVRRDEGGDVGENLRAAVAEIVTTSAWPIGRPGRQTIGVVGPAGVGKTTMLAKLAARAKLLDNRSVAFVTCDSFRVGAVDQIERYGELLQVNVHVARSANHLRELIEGETADIVFVDTSGRKPANGAPETVLRTMSPTSRNTEVLLCINASMRAADAVRTVASFGAAEPAALVVTKLDETDQPAGLLHAAVAAKLPIAVLGFGPRVPEDASPATVEDIATRLFPTRANGKRR